MTQVILQDEDIFMGDLVLVSAAHPLLQPASELTPVAPDIFLNFRARHALMGLLNVIGCGDAIVPVSAYRSQGEQAALYRNCLIERGSDYTSQFVALPGCSEHQTGLAIDLGENIDGLDFITPSFPNTGVYRYFRFLAPQFGFIQRYESGKEGLTGIAAEPWHFRYVGCPHSEIMAREGLCLEEYLHWLKKFPQHSPLRFGRAEIFFTPRQVDWLVTLPENAEYTVSGNNMDGCIITLWEEFS